MDALTLNLDIFTDDMPYSILEGSEFKEFEENLNTLDTLLDPEFYLEAYSSWKDPGHTYRTAASRSWELTQGAWKAHGDVTDGGGTLLKGIADMMIMAASLVAKIISFIMKMIAQIPNMIAGLLRNIIKIPENVLAMVRGDMRLYITIEDINVFREKVFPKLDIIINAADLFSQGDNWGTFLNPTKGKGGKNVGGPITRLIGHGKNEVGIGGLADQMEDVYNSISKMSFEKTNIKMDKLNVQLYFGAKSKYYKGISDIVDDFNTRKTKLAKVQTFVTDKLERTTMNLELATLTPAQQMKAKRTVTTISKTMTVVGNFLKYLASDIKAIDKQTKTIIAKGGIAPAKKKI